MLIIPQSLRFLAYSEDPHVIEQSTGRSRVRHFHIIFYLEDGSLKIVEPQQRNSGIQQGVYLSRTKTAKENGAPLTAADFKVGECVEIVGRRFVLADCDPKTRALLEREVFRAQMPAPLNIPPPSAPVGVTAHRGNRTTVSALQPAPTTMKAPSQCLCLAGSATLSPCPPPFLLSSSVSH